jgi:hypothetical protein
MPPKRRVATKTAETAEADQVIEKPERQDFEPEKPAEVSQDFVLQMDPLEQPVAEAVAEVVAEAQRSAVFDEITAGLKQLEDRLIQQAMREAGELEALRGSATEVSADTAEHERQLVMIQEIYVRMQNISQEIAALREAKRQVQSTIDLTRLVEIVQRAEEIYSSAKQLVDATLC